MNEGCETACMHVHHVRGINASDAVWVEDQLPHPASRGVCSIAQLSCELGCQGDGEVVGWLVVPDVVWTVLAWQLHRSDTCFATTRMNVKQQQGVSLKAMLVS